MGSVHRLIGSCALLFGALLVANAARAADTLTIYRCLAPKGAVTLQDRPCPKEARQDVKQMVRPQDAPPRPVTVAANLPPPPPRDIEVRVIREHVTRPMYECRTPDGETYTNDTGVPGGRYVPLWTYGYSGFRHGPSAGPHPVIAPTATTWVQDTCMRLSQGETCHLLRDRRDELGTRIFNAQADDRVRYEREQRVVDDQLRSDCNG